MSDREQALEIIRVMPEYKVTALLGFLRAFEDIPNAETIAAMQETDEMIRTGGGQHFTGSTADFFAMLDAEE
ncbi:MAG: hypothetical protein IKO14_06320 [Oscillibacter sp.]|nr:hypothetical protein [Oscillibacter sp.]